jgi:DNA repair exonuclease SbcCD nuclease subunit
MKIAIITDTHFGIRGDSIPVLEHQEKFYNDVFFNELEKRNIDTIIHLGDTFDRRKIINFNTLYLSKNMYFDKLKDYNYYCIAGNHDTYFTTTNSVNSVDLIYRENKNHHFYTDKATEINVDGLKILLCPWLTPDNKEENLKIIKKSKAQFLMGHFSIEGFEMMKGRLCEHGLNKDIFKHFEAVYSGHFHHPSEYNNIKYLGAPYEMVWSDYDEPRGFHILDTNTHELNFIENKYKLHHKIYYDDIDLTIDDVSNIDFSVLKGSFVKLIIKNKKNDYLFDIFKNRLNDSGALEVKVIENETLDSDNESTTEESLEAKDTREILSNYIDDLDELDNKKQKSLKSLIDDLYMEALNIQG